MAALTSAHLSYSFGTFPFTCALWKTDFFHKTTQSATIIIATGRQPLLVLRKLGCICYRLLPPAKAHDKFLPPTQTHLCLRFERNVSSVFTTIVYNVATYRVKFTNWTDLNFDEGLVHSPNLTWSDKKTKKSIAFMPCSRVSTREKIWLGKWSKFKSGVRSM